MESEDHEALGDELERETDALQQETDRLGEEISDVRQDWRAKRADPGTPGAVEPLGEDASEPPPSSPESPPGRQDAPEPPPSKPESPPHHD